MSGEEGITVSGEEGITVSGDDLPRFVLVAGATRTAAIEGISAAGADPELRWHTPAADAEILEYGGVLEAPVVPASPTGCPTPALVTRAAREVLGFETTVLDAGLAALTGAPTIPLGVGPGGDVREETPVPGADHAFERAREVGAGLPGDPLIGETIPGGTTTALGVLRALGEEYPVSSSLPENPLDLKREVVAEGLAASGIESGDLAGEPVEAVREMGDPVLAAAAGLARGALERGKRVRLAGGTQMIAVAALLRHAGVEGEIEVATTGYVADDPTADFRSAAADLDLDASVVAPGFEGHRGLERYAAGEAKEGVGMGGALDLAARADALPAVRERATELYATLVDDDGREQGGDR